MPRLKSTRPAVGQTCLREAEAASLRRRPVGSPGSLRRLPDTGHRAARRACPENRFAAIKLILFGRIVL